MDHAEHSAPWTQDEPIFTPQGVDTVDTPSYKERLLDLAREGKIKHTENYVKKLTEKTAGKIYRDYERKQLDEANNQLTDLLIKKFSELMGSLEAIKDSGEMEKELTDNELLRRD